MNKITDIKKERNAALVEAFHKVLKEAKSVDEAFEMLAGVEAPKFYVSLERARISVSRMVRAKWFPSHIAKLAMYEELTRRAMARWARGEKGYDCLEEIINEPAPSFYLDKLTMKGIVYREMRKRRR